MHKKRNYIPSLINDDNIAVSTSLGMCGIAKDYFTNLFSCRFGTYRPILDKVVSRVTLEDNDFLLASFTRDEFKQATFQMHLDKAPGPDGLNPSFYQRFWDLCGEEVYQAGCKWLQERSFPSQLTETNIVLIPKIDSPKSMKDLRPISLCNVLYKIVSKVLANRLRKIIPECISEEQSGFVEGRSILDNALIAIEVVHYMKCKTRGKVGDVALKIDISKAYDKVDWGFLQGMMSQLGFCETWVDWIMMCVANVSYSVQVNKDQVGPVVPEKGLRQGDPLSPYLYIICAEGLSILIKDAMQRGVLHGVSICQGAPMVSHLLFADDSFLFFRANEGETRAMKDILRIYEEASGQEVNFAKSEVFFSRNVQGPTRDSNAAAFGVSVALGTGRYLGLPSMVGQGKKAMFSFIKDRLWRKINAWNAKNLSMARREVLIKSVAQTILSYCMSVFLLPHSLCDDL